MQRQRSHPVPSLSGQRSEGGSPSCAGAPVNVAREETYVYVCVIQKTVCCTKAVRIVK